MVFIMVPTYNGLMIKAISIRNSMLTIKMVKKMAHGITGIAQE